MEVIPLNGYDGTASYNSQNIFQKKKKNHSFSPSAQNRIQKAESNNYLKGKQLNK